MFTKAQSQAFHQEGFVRIAGAMPEDVVAGMLARLWSLLESKGARRDDPSTWQPIFSTRLHAMRKDDPAPAACPALREALDSAFGGVEWFTKPHWGQALVTFPARGPWILPKSPWHLDHPFIQGRQITGLNMFLFVDHVGPQGGGTVVVRSSPRLIKKFVLHEDVDELRTMKSAAIKQRLFRAHPFLKELAGKPMRPDRNDRLMRADTEVDGIPMRVVEFTGKPGDVILAHPWLLHNITQNTADRPRLMRASRIYRRDFYEKYMGGTSDND
jgi:hypothetical protein